MALSSESTQLPDEWVSLKFDDRVFTMLRSTLVADRDSMFFALFGSSDSDVMPTLQRDMSHPLKPFIFDRSPKYVEPILNYLRSSELIIDSGVSTRGVLLEAQYFNVRGVRELLEDAAKPQEYRAPTDEDMRAANNQMNRATVERALITTPSGTKLRFAGLCFKELDLSHLDLSGINFTGSDFTRGKLIKCDLRGATLDRCSFVSCDLTDVNFSECSCVDADFTDAICVSTAFNLGNCGRAKFIRAILRYSDLGGVNLVDADLTEADLTGAVLKGANLRRAVLVGINRQGTALTMGGFVNTGSM